MICSLYSCTVVLMYMSCNNYRNIIFHLPYTKLNFPDGMPIEDQLSDDDGTRFYIALQ